MAKNIKTYSELILLPDFRSRFEYLMLGGEVGQETFGFERYLNQAFYHSREWRHARDFVIVRDSFDGEVCDLGCPDHPIFGRVYVHHMIPLSIEDIEKGSDILFDPEFLICTADLTHKGIHFGDYSLLPEDYTPRTPNDTCPWR